MSNGFSDKIPTESVQSDDRHCGNLRDITSICIMTALGVSVILNLTVGAFLVSAKRKTNKIPYFDSEALDSTSAFDSCESNSSESEYLKPISTGPTSTQMPLHFERNPLIESACAMKTRTASTRALPRFEPTTAFSTFKGMSLEPDHLRPVSARILSREKLSPLAANLCIAKNNNIGSRQHLSSTSAFHTNRRTESSEPEFLEPIATADKFSMVDSSCTRDHAYVKIIPDRVSGPGHVSPNQDWRADSGKTADKNYEIISGNTYKLFKKYGLQASPSCSPKFAQYVSFQKNDTVYKLPSGVPKHQPPQLSPPPPAIEKRESHVCVTTHLHGYCSATTSKARHSKAIDATSVIQTSHGKLPNPECLGPSYEQNLSYIEPNPHIKSACIVKTAGVGLSRHLRPTNAFHTSERKSLEPESKEPIPMTDNFSVVDDSNTEELCYLKIIPAEVNRSRPGIIAPYQDFRTDSEAKDDKNYRIISGNTCKLFKKHGLQASPSCSPKFARYVSFGENGAVYKLPSGVPKHQPPQVSPPPRAMDKRESYVCVTTHLHGYDSATASKVKRLEPTFVFETPKGKSYEPESLEPSSTQMSSYIEPNPPVFTSR